ncbi:hypothetical protein [Flavobacterium filum]|uniref:hypothetical protein n=1 Tax=Flavobacterium filum TaxID=370974 RepID=UPI0003FB7551|nr:hypothetical protein [Flavobacterium filum]
MKTIFALLGLFMFTSVSSTDFTAPVENGDGGSLGGGRKVLVIQVSENGDGGSLGGGRKVLVIQ